MAQGIELLDEALDLAHQEKNALENGAYEEAIELAERRGELTGMAWSLLDLKTAEKYRNRLKELHAIQDQLTSIAARTQDIIRNSLSKSRQEKKRMKGYHQAVGYALQ